MARSLGGVLALCALGACAERTEQPQRVEAADAAAPAARVERIVAFGDSYADDGNLFEMAGRQPPSIYPRGRFSNGTNFVDTMAELLGVPVLNFALGGAETGAGRANFDVQYRAFLAGGGPDFFPRVSGRFGPGDLAVVSIGGNDARAYGKSAGWSPSRAAIAAAIARAPAAAAERVRNAQRGLDALVAAGARSILFVGGDAGTLPEVSGTPIAPIGSAFSKSYNEGIRGLLASYAARGVRAVYLDLDPLRERVEANPAAFGMVSAGSCPRACLADPALADKYLFYVDRVHPTSAGFRIIGRAAVEKLAEAGLTR